VRRLMALTETTIHNIPANSEPEMNYTQSFLEQGYVVAPADNLQPLLKLRSLVFEKTCEIFQHTGDDPETFFNNFHRLDITGTRLNELRMQLIEHCNQHIDSSTLIFEAFNEKILKLLGPDLLVQKSTNLVIQQPNDPNPSELHRDAPANSPYEVVVWLPLTDAYGTKSMYMLNRNETGKALEAIGDMKDNWPAFEAYCLDHSAGVDVPFGTALFFWTGLFHGSRINDTDETRWTLNMRYKSLFAPNGMKEPFEFFKIFSMSPLTKLGIEFQKNESTI
jgi:sporadic carbohydrate cluster 2OG-Fe(II) oxygenase